MTVKRIIALLLCAVLAATAASCKNGDDGKTTATTNSDEAVGSDPSGSEIDGGAEKTIGFSVCNLQNEYNLIVEAGTRSEIEGMGYKYSVHDQKDDEAEMVKGAVDLINSGIDALIISPCKPEALSRVVDAAKEKGVLVIVNGATGSGGSGAGYDVILLPDSFDGGRQAADYTVELLTNNEGSREVAIIKCPPQNDYDNRRGEGYKESITAAGYGVVAEINGGARSEGGYSAMQGLLKSNPDIVAVFAENDPMALGAANALADADRHDVVVIGFNNDPEAIEAMRNGVIAGTVAQLPDMMGRLAASIADRLIKELPVPYNDVQAREILAPVNIVKRSY